MEYPDVGAVIVAAGLSSRMGEFKPMLPMGSDTIVRRVIKTFRSAGVRSIVLVTGYRGQELERHVGDLGVICLRNDAFEKTDMFHSARLGFAYYLGRCGRVLFTPVDVPLFTADTVKKLLAAEGALAVPVDGGRRGHPVSISASLLPALLADGGEGGLRSALKRCTAGETQVEVEDRGILCDADTPADYRALLEYRARRTEHAEKD